MQTVSYIPLFVVVLLDLNTLLVDDDMLAWEILHMKKVKQFKWRPVGLKSPWIKAYDRIRWGFILEILSSCGFAKQFIKIIQGYISTIEFEILFNEFPKLKKKKKSTI